MLRNILLDVHYIYNPEQFKDNKVYKINNKYLIINYFFININRGL